METQKNNQSMKSLMTILTVFVALVFIPPFIMIFLRFFTSKGIGLPIIRQLPGPLFIGIFPLLFMGVWLAVVAWVYRDAESRNMNGVLWGILCFVGNIIGLIVYLIMRNEELGIPLSIQSAACSSCNKAVDDGFVYCPYCGHKMQSECSSCGKPASPDWKVCPHCGAGLESKQ
ncbi:zinc-ribbon domain-containing protein [bacterium]|nr:zinc-ribbon domain-containing protein [bacterium]